MVKLGVGSLGDGQRVSFSDGGNSELQRVVYMSFLLESVLASGVPLHHLLMFVFSGFVSTVHGAAQNFGKGYSV